MAASYSVLLEDDTDWVRFLVGDTDVTHTMLDDEEITALLGSTSSNGKSGGRSSAVYYAAAEGLRALHIRWMSRGRGVASKKLQRLAIVYGTGSGINIDVAVQAKITELRKRGARLLAGSSYILRRL